LSIVRANFPADVAREERRHASRNAAAVMSQNRFILTC
jgi:hypothetical protein